MSTEQLTPDAFAFWQKIFLSRAALPDVSVIEAKAFADTAVELWAERKDAMRTARRLGASSNDGHHLLDGIEASIKHGSASKIGNIKTLRTTIVGLGLKDAKVAIEHYMQYHMWPSQIIEQAINTATRLQQAEESGP